MAKLDSQNRLLVPKCILEASKTDFSKEVRIYIKDDELFLDNPSNDNKMIRCWGIVHLDRNRRFCVKKIVRKVFNINEETDISCFLLNGRITYKKEYF